MRSHTAVAVDERGREVGQRTTTATATEDNLELLAWARAVGSNRTWAIEDCRALSRRLEEDLLAAGETVFRVSPKLMAGCRDGGRQCGKSDAIDALAVARAALREDGLPRAYVPGPTRELRVLVEHREHLIDERRRHMTRLRWHLHEIDPTWHPARASLTHEGPLAAAHERLAGREGALGIVARDLIDRMRSLTTEAGVLEEAIKPMVARMAPSLIALPGVRALTAAKILGQVGEVQRFRSKDAFASYNGTAPVPFSSGGRTRYRRALGGNRQINSALHAMAIAQANYFKDARAFIDRRVAAGNPRRTAIRALKRHLSDVVYKALLTDSRQELSADDAPRSGASRGDPVRPGAPKTGSATSHRDQAFAATLVGTREAAAVLHTSPHVVRYAAENCADFPPAVARLATGRVWDRGSLERWHEIHPQRRRRRPPQVSAETLAQIVALHDAGMGWTAIARRFNSTGMPTPRGKSWWAAGVRRLYDWSKAQPLSAASFGATGGIATERVEARPDIVGKAEIAAMLGIPPRAVRGFADDSVDFPPPLIQLAQGRLWSRTAVESWSRTHSRRLSSHLPNRDAEDAG